MSIAAPNPSKPQAAYPTAAAWWDALGNVPLERIIFDPWPGSATERDVLDLNDHQDRICELVEGTLVEKAMGYEESLIAAELIRIIGNFVRARKLGRVSGEAGMMRILKGRVRIPDVAFVSNERLAQAKGASGPIPEIAPDLAVEIISESNTEREMSRKLEEYFTAGVKLVWYVDPRTRTIDVHTAPGAATRLAEGDTLGGGEVLPGFSVPVAEVFDIV